MDGWERALGALFDDLEGQAEAAFAEERAWEVLDRADTEFATVDLVGRLMAIREGEVALQVSGPGRVMGRLSRVTETWCLVEGSGQEWLVPLAAVGLVEGLTARSVAREARPITARLGLGSALRRVAATRIECRIWLRDGSTRDGQLGRVGADFVELAAPGADRRRPAAASIAAPIAAPTAAGGGIAAVPWSALGAVQSRP